MADLEAAIQHAQQLGVAEPAAPLPEDPFAALPRTVLEAQAAGWRREAEDREQPYRMVALLEQIVARQAEQTTLLQDLLQELRGWRAGGVARHHTRR